MKTRQACMLPGSAPWTQETWRMFMVVMGMTNIDTLRQAGTVQQPLASAHPWQYALTAKLRQKQTHTKTANTKTE